MQNNKFKVFIIAGEVSGDVLGARIMSEMKDAEFIGVGGENMIAAGLKPLFPMADLAVMGVVEVAAHARTLTRRIRQTADAIIAAAPDIVVTIDAPGFAKSVIKRVRKMPDGKKLVENGLRFHHVVAPQVWAWGAWRAKKYIGVFDKLYSFFDFERPYFTNLGLETVAVGHPIADGIIGRYAAKQTDEKIITLVPGSRMSEVKRLLPLFEQVAEMLCCCGYRDYKFVIPTVETTADYVARHTEKWCVKPTLVPAAGRYDLYSKTYIAIVASGTVSAELAMMHVPTIVVYKMNPLTTWLVRQVIRVRWVSLVNILMNKPVYPEFLGAAAVAENIMDAVCQLSIPSVRAKMVEDLCAADKLWQRADGGAARLVADGVRRAIKK